MSTLAVARLAPSNRGTSCALVDGKISIVRPSQFQFSHNHYTELAPTNSQYTQALAVSLLDNNSN
jgi:hypothetical protein